MNILICRTTKSKLFDAFNYLHDELIQKYGSFVLVNNITHSIDIFGIGIDFKCGTKNNLVGLRPNYYNVDSKEASEFMCFNAVKYRGIEIFDITEIPDIVEKHIDFIASGLNNEDSTMLQNICRSNGVDHNMMLSAIVASKSEKRLYAGLEPGIRETEPEMIKATCSLFMLDKPTVSGYLFPKDCKIDLPDNVPIHINSINNKPIGLCHSFERNESYVTGNLDINLNKNPELKQQIANGEIYAGVFCTDIKKHKENELTIVDSIKLRSVSLCKDDFYGDKSFIVKERLSDEQHN